MKGKSPVSVVHSPLLSNFQQTASSKVQFSLCLNPTGGYLDKLQWYSTSTLTFARQATTHVPQAMFSL